MESIKYPPVTEEYVLEFMKDYQESFAECFKIHHDELDWQRCKNLQAYGPGPQHSQVLQAMGLHSTLRQAVENGSVTSLLKRKINAVCGSKVQLLCSVFSTCSMLDMAGMHACMLRFRLESGAVRLLQLICFWNHQWS